MKNKFLVFTLLGLSVFAACKKDTDDTDNSNNNGSNNNGNNTPTTLTISSSPSFSGTLDGTLKNYASMFGYGTDGDTFLNSGVLLEEQEGVYLSKGNYNSSSLLFDFFNEGAVTFSGNGSNGIVVVWKDASDNEWRSDKGSQSGSTFSFNTITENNTFPQNVKYKATFSCKLYNEAGTAHKSIDGQMVGYFYDLM